MKIIILLFRLLSFERDYPAKNLHRFDRTIDVSSRVRKTAFALHPCFTMPVYEIPSFGRLH